MGRLGSRLFCLFEPPRGKEMYGMSAQTIRVVVAGVLFLHGIAHIGPIATYVWIKLRPGDPTGGWVAARSWLVPSLRPSAAMFAASLFWFLSIVGFVAAALFLRGVLDPEYMWRQLAVGASIVSTVGIVVFFGTWPIFNTLAALAVNVAVLVTQLWMHWPPASMYGS
jgi:hypothetical protein